MEVINGDITFSAASTAGLNNPGTEIITLVKDGSGNFINPPSYDKMRAYLRSGEVPMLFVTTDSGESSSLYQLDEYSGTKNKIRFSNSTNAIEFCARCEVPVVSEVGGATTLHINVTAVDMETMKATFTVDKTPAEMRQASANGPIWCVLTFAAGVMSEESISFGVPPAFGPSNAVVFGNVTLPIHDKNGENDVIYAIYGNPSNDEWSIDLRTFGGN